MRLFIICLAMASTFSSFATVTVGRCPGEFEGKVRAIAASMGPSSAFSTQKVIFDNQHTVRGEVEEEVVLTMLENGPFKVEAGKDYRVQVKNGKLCWIEEL